ncbi:flavodoxin family protein [Desulforhabdus amnigena]|uniref:FMN reductase n=1 Tax=Desulforhabdus amnigena TaxID=40218 RepID=A0A9W6FUL3_9BACT|nr:flavodoxin family protein [Desulforhabdus amnigena]NLJ29076.1 flavodoxin family protein [Deltaproteobacteria bacterium]GLI35185.1 FMN reductase [Desulforhabdus amnigena]
MQVVGIYGSPRKGGNTDLMLDAFLEGAAAAGGDIQRIYVRDLNIKGCLGCGHCDKKGTCIQKDDMTGLYPILENAPRIVVASPIYFYGVTGQLKLLIDRSQASFMLQDLAKKEGRELAPRKSRKGFLLSAGATRGKRLFECAILTAKYFFDALNMDYAGELCFRELDQRGAVLKHPTALDECRRAGEAFLAQD